MYGSHTSMLVPDDDKEIGSKEDYQKELKGLVQLRDDKGIYWTEIDRLDTGLADPNRYNNR